MRYDYNITGNEASDFLALESAFNQLEQLKNKAQNEIYNITHETSFDNIFKKAFKIIIGYNSSLLRQYMRILDNFVEKASEALQSKSVIDVNIITPEYKKALIDIIKWIIEIYDTRLTNKKIFKNNNASMLLGTLYELLDEMNNILYNIIINNPNYIKKEKENIKEEFIPQKKSTKGFIDINEYMIDSFS